MMMFKLNFSKLQAESQKTDRWWEITRLSAEGHQTPIVCIPSPPAVKSGRACVIWSLHLFRAFGWSFWGYVMILVSICSSHLSAWHWTLTETTISWRGENKYINIYTHYMHTPYTIARKKENPNRMQNSTIRQ